MNKVFVKDNKLILVLISIFLILGIGNTVFGIHKTNFYQKALSLDSSQISRDTQNKVTINRYKEKILARINFYKVTTFGGKIFISIAFFIFIYFFLIKSFYFKNT